MRSPETIKQWLLKNCVDKEGNLDISNLDFSDFNGDVYFSHIKVKQTLYQFGQEVKGDLRQSFQHVNGKIVQNQQTTDSDLYQNYQVVKGNLYQFIQSVKGDLEQYGQTVKGKFINHKLSKNEHWENYGIESVIKVKELKPITKEELLKKGYNLKEE